MLCTFRIAECQKLLSLGDLFAKYRDSLPLHAKELSTLETEEIHLRHFHKHLPVRQPLHNITTEVVHLAVGDSDRQAIELYDCSSWRLAARFSCGELNPQRNLALMNSQLVGLGRDSLYLFDLNLRRSAATSGFWYAPFATSRESPCVVFPATSGAIGSWNVLEGGFRLFKGANDKKVVSAIACSTDGQRIAAARNGNSSEASAIEIWDAITGKIVKQFAKHKNKVWTLAFLPGNSEVLISAGDKGEAYLIDLRDDTFLPLKHSDGEERTILSSAFSPSGDNLVLGGGTWGPAWQYTPGKPAHHWKISARTNGVVAEYAGSLPTHKSYATSFSPDGKRMVFIDLEKDRRQHLQGADRHLVQWPG